MMTTPFGAWTVGVVASVAALVAGWPAGAQEFRTGVILRVLDLVVTDAHGRPARGLGPEDFQITEDRTPVTIRFVTPFEVSAESGVVTARDPDVWTNAGVASSRVFAVVLDDLNTRASDTAKARSVAQAFIDRLPQGDLASLVFTGQQTGAQEFTSDKARLAQVLRQYTGRFALPDRDIVGGDFSSVDHAMRATLGGEVAGNHERSLQTLLNVTEWLSTIQDRRKSILFVTAGLEPALARAFLGGLDDGTFSGTTVGGLFARLVAQAAAANVAIYPLDYQGLSAPESRPTEQRDAGGLNPLMVMASETGGVAGVNNNDPGRLFDRLIQDASAYYLVGYEPSARDPSDRKARAHRLTVRMRSATLSARARRTYVSQPATAAADRKATTAQLLSSPLPGGALGLSVHVSAFPKGNGQARAFAVLEVAGDDLQAGLVRANEMVEVKYRLVATDVEGRVKASDAHDVTLRLSRERLQQITRQRLRIFSHLDLPTGSYRVRASVVHGDAHGVVAGDVDIPDYKKASFIVSQPLVVSSGTATIPVRREDYEPFKGRLSAAPTAQRVFGVGETLEVYAEVHMPRRQGTGRTPDRALVARAIILNASREKVREMPAHVGSVARGLAGGLVYPITAASSFSDLPVGPYELEVIVEADGHRSVTRRVTFALR